ncbi:MAG: hypothetical protein JSU09_15280 [Bacteroidetes bacterium]|nr:hypothetical protein [Bacteroidota bacterium]
MNTLIIGEGKIGTDEEGYTKLINFYESCNKYASEKIIIDFEKISWIDGNMAALLMAIILKLEKERGNTFFVDQTVISDRFHILIRNGLLKGVEFIPRNDKTEIKLTGFGKNEDVKFIEYIENELLSNPNLSVAKAVKKKLVDAFLELFCNVQKHARTDSPIFACGQYYPSLKRLSFTLVDTGVGYLDPIREFTGESKNDGGGRHPVGLERKHYKKGCSRRSGFEGDTKILQRKWIDLRYYNKWILLD